MLWNVSVQSEQTIDARLVFNKMSLPRRVAAFCYKSPCFPFISQSVIILVFSVWSKVLQIFEDKLIGVGFFGCCLGVSCFEM